MYFRLVEEQDEADGHYKHAHYLERDDKSAVSLVKPCSGGSSSLKEMDTIYTIDELKCYASIYTLEDQISH